MNRAKDQQKETEEQGKYCFMIMSVLIVSKCRLFSVLWNEVIFLAQRAKK